MKRLLCILSSMNAGGAETYLMKLYRNIDRTKYQMDFCINEKKKTFYEDEIVNFGGKIFRIPSKSENLKEFRNQLSTIIKEKQYKYVMRITSNAAGFMDLKIAKKAGAMKCIARSSNSNDGGGFKAIIAHKIGRLLYNKSVDVRIAPSDLAAIYTFGKKAYKCGEVTILKNALDLTVFCYNEHSRKRVRSEFDISDDMKVIGHIGRFNAQKNHEFLIDVFFEIHKKDAFTLLLLVGDGELQQQIRNKIILLGLSEAVIFAGVRSDIPSLLSAMDVFVFPSLYEGMPNVVVEAQATGLPCIISDTITREANITDLVRYLPLTLSASEWANQINEVITTSRKNTKDDFIQNGYDINSVCKKFISCIFGEISGN